MSKKTRYVSYGKGINKVIGRKNVRVQRKDSIRNRIKVMKEQLKKEDK